MKEDQFSRNAPPVGQYNPRFESVEQRMGRLTYFWKKEKHRYYIVTMDLILFDIVTLQNNVRVNSN
jgi:hypothetical protein